MARMERVPKIITVTNNSKSPRPEVWRLSAVYRKFFIPENTAGLTNTANDPVD